MTRVLVLGASGMLGHKLCHVLPEHGLEVLTTVRGRSDRLARFGHFFRHCFLVEGVDALDGERVEQVVRELRPAWIVNGVGIVKQLPEAEDRYLSVAVNSLLPHRLARVAAECGAHVVHFGTDCVFDGTRGLYRETDPSDAKDLYGRSKYLGETDEREPAALTLRSSIVGQEIGAPKTGLIEWFLAQAGKSVKGFARAVYTGLTTREMARLVARLIVEQRRLVGTRQVASAPITKHDLLGLVRDAYGLPVEIVRDETFVCDRSLVMDRFRTEVGYAPPDWPTMIREMAAERHLYA